MITLGIENSGTTGSVALLNGSEVIETSSFDCPRGRGSGLFVALDRIVEKRIRPDKIIVGTGPGSYNGLRSAIAAAWGLSVAYGSELSGVSSLLAYESNAYLTVGDARGGQFYFAHVANGAFLEEPILLSPQALVEKVAGLLDCPVFTPGEISFLPQARTMFPRAEILVRVAMLMPAKAGMPEPLYLKPPHITQPRKV